MKWNLFDQFISAHTFYDFNLLSDNALHTFAQCVSTIFHPQHYYEGSSKPQILNKVAKEDEVSASKDAPPPPIRITLASVDEYNHLLQNGLDFYGATFFPTESNLPQLGAVRIATKKGR